MRIILEQQLTSKEAMTILGLSPGFKKEDLASAYKQAAKLAHPDRGGSTEKMQKINAANEVLKTAVGGPTMINVEDVKDKIDAAHASIQELLKKEIVPQRFVDYFQKFTDEHLQFTVHFHPHSRGSHYGLVKYEFFSHSRDLVFIFDISFDAFSVAYAKKSIGDHDIPVIQQFDYSITNYLYHDGLQQKLGLRTWSYARGNLNISDPAAVFPEVKLKKIFGGEKSRKFSKRDFIEGLKRKIPKLDSNQGTYFASLPDGWTFRFSRSTILRMASWSVHDVYKGKLRLGIKPNFIPESPVGFDLIMSLFKELTACNGDQQKLAAVVASWMPPTFDADEMS